MKSTLLIAAHGSHLDARSSEPVHRHAAVLRQSGRFGAVLTGFWKEEPALCRALDGVERGPLIVVPFFMADGYFTRTVIPREIARAYADEITMTRPLGLHPGLAGLVESTAIAAGAGPGDTVVVLGHGTPRSATSAAAAADHAAALRARAMFAQVLPLYLDQEPSIGRFDPSGHPGKVVVVPLFVSDGWHVGTSIPEAMAEGAARSAILTSAVGAMAGAAELIAELAAEAAGVGAIP
jgi:sirohydrochlorin cobaltochelatase